MTTRMGSGRAAGANAKEAARSAVQQALQMAGPDNHQLAIAFAWSTYDLDGLVKTIREELGSEVPLIGCSSSGEFTQSGSATGEVAVALLASDAMKVRVGLGEDMSQDYKAAVKNAVGAFVGLSDEEQARGWRGRTMLLFSDGLAGRAELVIDELMNATDMQYQLFGGAAADDVSFKQTFVFAGEQVYTDAFVVAEVLTERPFGISLMHGWKRASKSMRVTRASGAVLQELNGRPAWEVYREVATEAGFEIEEGKEAAFLMNHVLGMESADGDKLRVPLAVVENGALMCAAEVDTNSIVRIMRGDDDAIRAGGERAAKQALEKIEGQAAGALVCECVATRLRLGDRFDEEVRATASAVDGVPVAGAVSFGQLARIQGQFTGLMDATSLICIVPE